MTSVSSAIGQRSRTATPYTSLSKLAGTDLVLSVTNLDRGEVIEVGVSRPVTAEDWPTLHARLLVLISRQPAELRLDLDAVGGVHRFPEGLELLERALAEFGSRLTINLIP